MLAAHQGVVSSVEVPPGRRQQAEVIPPDEQVDPPTTANLCRVFAMHQIRALATGQGPPTIHTEAEARAAHAALVRELFDALRNALVQHPPDTFTNKGPKPKDPPYSPDAQIFMTATIKH